VEDVPVKFPKKTFKASNIPAQPVHWQIDVLLNRGDERERYVSHFSPGSNRRLILPRAHFTGNCYTIIKRQPLAVCQLVHWVQLRKSRREQLRILENTTADPRRVTCPACFEQPLFTSGIANEIWDCAVKTAVKLPKKKIRKTRKKSNG